MRARSRRKEIREEKGETREEERNKNWRLNPIECLQNFELLQQRSFAS